MNIQITKDTKEKIRKAAIIGTSTLAIGAMVWHGVTTTAKLNDLQKKIVEMEGILKEVNTDRKNLKPELEKAKKRIANLENIVAKLEKIESTTKTINRKIDTTSKEVGTIKKRLTRPWWVKFLPWHWNWGQENK